MEEKLNNNQEPKTEKLKNGKKEPSVKTKRKKAKIAVITLSTIVILFVGLQVYASTNGYGNVFFMIKNLITTGNPAGINEIFSDKDITLSYRSIELADGLKIQANRLEIKDRKTKIYLTIKGQKADYLPLKYEITTKSNDGTEVTTITKVTGNKVENVANFEYEDVLSINYAVEENKTIILKINDLNDKELRTLEINLQTREITVKGEKEFEKISEIELKKYLSMYSELNNNSKKEDALLYIAQKFKDNYKDFMSEEDYQYRMDKSTDRAYRNAIIKEFYGDKAEFEYKKQKDASKPEVEVLKGITAWEFDKDNDSYKQLTAGEEYQHGKCLKIEDISYEDGIYTVKYIYLLATGIDEDADRLEELPQYETTIKLKRDDKNLYSKYQIVSIEDGTELNYKISTNVEEDNNKEGNNSQSDENIDYIDLQNTNKTAENNTYIINNNSNTTYNTNTTNVNNTNTKDEIMNTANWKQVWPDIGMKFRLPNNFVQGQVIENDSLSVNLTGYIITEKFNFETQKKEGDENVPVKLIFYNEINKNTNLMDYLLFSDEDRIINSTDNKGWTNWCPLKYDNVSESPENGYIRRSYGRVREDQIQKVIFDMKSTSGIGLEHYRFIRNVLESVSSTSR